METKVINIYAGPGVGKSTTAAMLYAHYKNKCLEAEMCREYVKSWVWQARNITAMDQYYILGKEIYHMESLFGKVDVLISDSPVMQGNYYLHKIRPDLSLDSTGPMDPLIFDFITQAEKRGVKFYDFIVERNQPYQTTGRYQTEEEAIQDHKDIIRFLHQPIRNKFLNLHIITGDRDERLNKIVEIVDKS